MRKLKYTAIILALLVVACAGGQVLTNQDYYDEAVSWWLNTEQNFKMIYNQSTSAEQKEMLPFLKILHESKGVLDVWGMNLNGDKPTDTQIEQWKAYKNKLILMMANNYKEKHNGG